MAGPTEPGPRGRPSAGTRAATSLGRPASHRLPGASRGDGPSTTAGAAVGLTGKAARASWMDARPGLGLELGSCDVDGQRDGRSAAGSGGAGDRRPAGGRRVVSTHLYRIFPELGVAGRPACATPSTA